MNDPAHDLLTGGMFVATVVIVMAILAIWANRRE